MTLDEALRYGIGELQNSSESAALDASVLLQHVADLNNLDLIMRSDEEISETNLSTYKSYIERRLKHEPVAYITGEKEFWGLPFKVRKGVLIPRPDTETIVGTLLALIPEQSTPLTIADLGCGSGCILLSILSEYTESKGFGVDMSQVALSVSKENAENLKLSDRVDFFLGNWAEPLPEKVNIVVSNPPYIKPDVYENLLPNVKNHEPVEALKAEDNGLACYKEIVPAAYDKLHDGGLLMLEIGYDQKEDVLNLLDDKQWPEKMCFKDLAGHDRLIVGIKAK